MLLPENAEFPIVTQPNGWRKNFCHVKNHLHVLHEGSSIRQMSFCPHQHINIEPLGPSFKLKPWIKDGVYDHFAGSRKDYARNDVLICPDQPPPKLQKEQKDFFKCKVSGEGQFVH